MPVFRVNDRARSKYFTLLKSLCMYSAYAYFIECSHVHACACTCTVLRLLYCACVCACVGDVSMHSAYFNVCACV